MEETQNDQKKKSKEISVKIGDLVYLQTISNKSNKLIVFGDGIANSELLVLSSNEKIKNNAIKQFRKCIFQIQKCKQYYYQNLLQQFEKDSQEESEKLFYLRQKAQEEQLENESQEIKDKDDVLTYGQKIQLKHVFSGTVIALNQNFIAKQPGCLILELNQKQDDSANFQVIPQTSLSQYGDVVKYGDSLAFNNIANKTFFIHLYQETSDDDFQKESQEINASEALTYFKIKSFGCNDQEIKPDYLYNYKTISIFNQDLQLKVDQEDIQDNLSKKQIFYHNIKNDQESVFLTIDYLNQEDLSQKKHQLKIEEIDLKDQKKMILKNSDPFAFWEIQPDGDNKVEMVSTNKNYRLLNVGSNLYLKAQNNQLSLTTDYKNEYTLFNFEILDSNEQYVSFDSNQILIKTMSGQYLSTMNDLLVLTGQDQKKFNISQRCFQFCQLENQFQKTIDKITSINPSLINFIIKFQDFGQNEDLIQNVVNKKNRIPILRKYTEDQKITFYNLKQAKKQTKLLQQEQQKLNDTLKSIEQMLEEISEISVKNVQKILLENKTMDYLILTLKLIHNLTNNQQDSKGSNQEKVSEKQLDFFQFSVQQSPFRIAKQYLCVAFDMILNLLIKIVNKNKRASEYFLSANTQFIFEISQHHELCVTLYKSAFIYSYYLGKDQDRYGDQLLKWIQKLEVVNQRNINTQIILTNLIYHSFTHKNKSNSIYQTRFLKEVMITENDVQLGQFQKRYGLGKFIIVNQQVGFKFNTSADFLAENQILEQGIQDKTLTNYSDDDTFTFLLSDIDKLQCQKRKQDFNYKSFYSEYILSVLKLLTEVCNNQNQKCQKLVQKLGMSSELLINLLEDKNQPLKRLIYVQQLYNNLYLNINGACYLNKFENKTIIWQNQQSVGGSNMLAPIFQSIQNFEANISEQLSQGFIIDQVYQFWNDSQIQIAQHDTKTLILFLLQQLNFTKIIINRGFSSRKFNIAVLKGIINIFLYFQQFMEQKLFSFDDKNWLYIAISHITKKNADSMIYNDYINQIFLVCMEIFQLLSQIQNIILTQNIMGILQNISQDYDESKLDKEINNKKGSLIAKINEDIKLVYEEFSDNQVEQTINIEENKNSVQNKQFLFEVAGQLNELNPLKKLNFMQDENLEIKEQEENHYLLSVLFMFSILVKNNAQFTLMPEVKEKILQNIISIFNQKFNISKTIVKYDIVFGLEELEIYREFNGTTSYTSKVQKIIKKLKKYQFNDQLLKKNQIKIDDQIKSLIQCICDINQKFKDRKSDSGLQSKMQNMIQSFKIQTCIVDAFKISKKIQFNQNQKDYLAKFLLNFVKQNKLGQQNMVQDLEFLFNYLTCKNVPRLCVEILFGITNQETTWKYIDILLLKLDEKKDDINFKYKIIQLLKALCCDRFGVPIFDNQQKILGYLLNNKSDNLLNFQDNIIQNFFEKRLKINENQLNQKMIYSQNNYLELLIALSIKNRMGILNISKNFTYEQLKNLLCNQNTFFILKPSLLKIIFNGFINEFQKNNQKQIDQIKNYLSEILAESVLVDLSRYQEYIQGLVETQSDNKKTSKKQDSYRANIAQLYSQQLITFDYPEYKFNNIKPAAVIFNLNEYWLYYQNGKSWDNSNNGLINFIFECFLIVKGFSSYDPNLIQILDQILSQLNIIRNDLIKINKLYDIDIRSILFSIGYLIQQMDSYIGKYNIYIKDLNQRKSQQPRINSSKLSVDYSLDNIIKLIMIKQQLEIKHFRIIFQKDDIYITTNKFLDKLVLTLSNILQQIDSNNQVIETHKVKEYLIQMNLIDNEKFVDVQMFFEFLNKRFYHQETKDDLNLSTKRPDRFLQKVHTNIRIKNFLKIFEENQQPILNDEIRKFNKKLLLQILTIKNVKDIIQYKVILKQNLQILIKIFEQNQEQTEYLITILINLINQIQEFVENEKGQEKQTFDPFFQFEQEKQIDYINEIQLVLDDSGVTQFATEQLINYQNKSKKLQLKACLELLVKLCQGNSVIQQNLYQIMQNNETALNFTTSYQYIFQILFEQDQDINSNQQKKENINLCSQILEYGFQFLRILCENCFTKFQDFLRDPIKDKKQNVNLILEISGFLLRMKQKDFYNSDYLEFNKIRILCLQTLMNFCKGPCPENQKIICQESQLISYINVNILQIEINFNSKDAYNNQNSILFQETVQFILSIISENTDRDVLKKFTSIIDIRQLINKMHQIYNYSFDNKKDKIYKQDECNHKKCEGQNYCYQNKIIPNDYKIIQTGFNIFIIIDCLKSQKFDEAILLDIDSQDLETVEQNIKNIQDNDKQFTIKYQQYFSQTEELEKEHYQTSLFITQNVQKKNQIQSIDFVKNFQSIITPKVDLVSEENLSDDDENENQNSQNHTPLNLMNFWFKDDIIFTEYMKLVSLRKFFICKPLFQNLIGNIELQIDGKLIMVFFQKPLISIYLSKLIKEDLIYDAPMDTNQIRLKFAIKQSFYYENQMKFHQLISKNQLLNQIQKSYLLKFITRICVVSLNVIFLLYASHHYTTELVTDSSGTYNKTTVDMNEIYFTYNYQYNIDNKLNYTAQNNSQIIEIRTIFNYIHLVFAILYMILYTINQLPKSFEFIDRPGAPKKNLKSIFTTLYKLIDFQNIYNFSYCLISIFALQQPYLYGILFIDIFSKNPVFITLKQNYQILLKTLFLILIIIYIFSLYSFYYLNGQYYENYGNPAVAYDDTLFKTFLSTLNYGLRFSITFQNIFGQNDEKFPRQQAWAVCFFIIINQIMMNIIFGLIISGFGKNREVLKQKEINITQKCYICGIKNYQFEMKGNGWLNHIYMEHNVYQYIFYIIYVRNKKIEECNLIEKKVKEDLANEQPDFFPVGQAICLQKYISDHKKQEEDEENKSKEESN